MNTAGLARSLETVRVELLAATEQVMAAPLPVRNAFATVRATIGRALRAAKEEDERSLGLLTLRFLEELQTARLLEQEWRRAAVSSAVRPEPVAAGAR